MKNNRQYRTASKIEPTEGEYRVEGYAARFEPYVLYDDEGGAIYEQFTRDAFEFADKSDIIMQYNHEGRVFARNSNGTLDVNIDDNGLHIVADLSKTESARQLHEEIKAGMITKMSWGFMPGEYDYNPDTRTITHTKVKKIFDVSAVSIPANNDTTINARNFFDGEIKEVARRDAELKDRKKRLLLKLQLEVIK